MNRGRSGSDAFGRVRHFRVILGLVVLAAVVLFAALNTDKVNVDWALDTADVALWIVIAVSVVAGVVIGFLARPRHR